MNLKYSKQCNISVQAIIALEILRIELADEAARQLAITVAIHF